MTDNPPIRIYVNKTENRITFRAGSGYDLVLATPETIKLLRSTKTRITENKNGEHEPHLEITEVALVHCNNDSSHYQEDSIVLYTFVLNKSFVPILDIHTEILFLEKL